MIIINNVPIPTLEAVGDFVQIMKDMSYMDEHKDFVDIYSTFLLECYEADQRLQQMVFDRFGEGYYSFVILPVEDTDDLQSFSFQLATEEDVKIKRRDELVYQDFCDICFGNIKPYYTRLFEYASA